MLGDCAVILCVCVCVLLHRRGWLSRVDSMKKWQRQLKGESASLVELYYCVLCVCMCCRLQLQVKEYESAAAAGKRRGLVTS